MGHSSYNYSSRSLRSADQGYTTKGIDQIFEQNKKRAIYETLNPEGVKLRECCDSKEHPVALPIVIGLDVTGSMGKIPHMLIKDGLPKMVSRLHEKRLTDASICFIAVGDHLNDSAPLQVAQFESGDAELDTHLTRTWLEGNGGGNGGESYPLAWYFAAFHTKTDQWDKRGKKGFLFTIGDEPFHRVLQINALRGIFGDTTVGGETYSAETLYKKVCERWNVYHINTNGNTYGLVEWKDLLGEHLLNEPDYKNIPDLIASTVAKHADIVNVSSMQVSMPEIVKPQTDNSIIL